MDKPEKPETEKPAAAPAKLRTRRVSMAPMSLDEDDMLPGFAAAELSLQLHPIWLGFYDPQAEYDYHAHWSRSFASAMKLIARWTTLMHTCRLIVTLATTAVAAAERNPGVPFWLADGGLTASQILIVLGHFVMSGVAHTDVLKQGRFHVFHACCWAFCFSANAADCVQVFLPQPPSQQGQGRLSLTCLHLFPIGTIVPCILMNLSWYKSCTLSVGTVACLFVCRARGLTQPWFGAEDLTALVNYCFIGTIISYMMEYRMRKAWILSRCLRRARDEADAGLREKSLFLSNTNHEIRTPLFAIIGMTDILQETRLDVEQADCVRTLRSCADVLLAMVSDILDLEKAHAGRLDIQRAPFSPLQAVESVADMLFVGAGRKRVDIAAEVDARLADATLEGDSARFKQIILNLASNAVKFSAPEGEGPVGEVAVRLAPGGEPGGGGGAGSEVWVRLDVSDNGIGIAPDRLPELFRPFGQLDASITRRYGGSGLGLALVKTLTEKMGGRVAVSSTPGEGSTFTVALPFGAVPGGGGAGRGTGEKEAGAGKKEDSDDEGEEGRRGGPPVAVEVAGGRPCTRRCLLRQLRAVGCRPVDGREEAAALVTDDRQAAEEAARDSRGSLLVLLLDAPGARRSSNLGGAPSAPVPLPEVLPEFMDLCPPGRGPPAPRGPTPASVRRLALPVRLGALREALQLAAGGAARARGGRRQRPSSCPDLGAARPVDAGRHSPASPSPTPEEAIRVLIAEDNPLNAMLLSRMLRKLRCAVEAVGDGQAAVEACRAGRVDVLLTDIAMPIKSGLDACAEIRALQAAGAVPPHVAVIGCSANALPEDRERALAAGMAAFIPKPVRLEQVSAALRAHARRGGAREAPAAGGAAERERSDGEPPSEL